LHDDTSQQSIDGRVTVIETASGKILAGEEAPTASQLQSWLEAHPGWEPAPREDDGSDDEGSDADDSDEEATATGMDLWGYL